MGDTRPKGETLNTAALTRYALIGAGALLGIIVHNMLPPSLKATIGQ